MKSDEQIQAATLAATEVALNASDTVTEAATLLLYVAHNLIVSQYGQEKADHWLLTQALSSPKPEGSQKPHTAH